MATNSPMSGKAPIDSDIVAALEGSIELVKALKGEVADAERNVDRFFQEIKNKTIAGDWQVSFDATRDARGRLDKAEQHNRDLQDKLEHRQALRAMPGQVYETVRGLMSGGAAGGMVGGIMGAAATAGPWAAIAWAAKKAFDFGEGLARDEYTNAQASAQAISDSASDMVSMLKADRITGGLSPEYAEAMFRWRSSALTETVNWEMAHGNAYQRLRQYLGGAATPEANTRALEKVRQDQDFKERSRVFGQAYADAVDLERIQREHGEQIYTMRWRRLRSMSTMESLGTMIAGGFDWVTGGDPIGRMDTESARELRQGIERGQRQARETETRFKTQEGERGIAYRAYMKDRNVRIEALHNKLYESFLQWNTF